MSENTSGQNKPEHSAETEDQIALLDELIDQFEGDDAPDFNDDSPSEPIEPEIPDKPVTASEPEPGSATEQTTDEPKPESSNIVMMLAAFVAVVVIAVVIWLSLGDSDNKHAPIDIGKPVTAPSAPVSAPSQPKAVNTSQTTAEKDVSAIEQPPVAAAQEAPKAEPTETKAQPEAKNAAQSNPIQHLVFDPNTRELVSPVAANSKRMWAINLTSLARLEDAEAMRDDLIAKGTACDVVWISIGDKSFYRIRMPGFANMRAAEKARKPYAKIKEFETSWVSSYHQ